MAKENKNGMVNGMPSLERELGKDYFTSVHSMRRVLFFIKFDSGAIGGKMDIVKQVEAAEKLAKIEADFVRVKSEVDLSQNKFSEQKRRTENMEGDISDLLVSKDLFQMKLNAAETECIGKKFKIY